MASVKEDAPTGRIMNSCIASALPAWLPPLMMLKLGTGSTCRQSQRSDQLQATRSLMTHRKWCMTVISRRELCIAVCISDWCLQPVCHTISPALP